MIGRRAAAIAIAGAVLSGCGGGGGGGDLASDPAFPTLSVVTAATIGATASDPTGDAGDPAVDITAASATHDGTTLHVSITLAAPPPLATSLAADEQYSVGAYLLRDQNDDAPRAARLLIDRAGGQRFLFGPWLADGQPIVGAVTGTVVTLTVPSIDTAVYRYVQFYAESTTGADVAPDDSPTSPGVLPLN